MTNEYVAGLFDGEGCVYIAKRLTSMQINITQNTTGILQLLQNKFGGKITQHTNGKGITFFNFAKGI